MPEVTAGAANASKRAVTIADVWPAALGLFVLVSLLWAIFWAGPIGRHNWTKFHWVAHIHIPVPDWLADAAHFFKSIPHLPSVPLTIYGLLIAVLMAIALAAVARWSRVSHGLALGFTFLVISFVVAVFAAIYSQAAHDHSRGLGACFAYTQGPSGVLHPAHVGHWDALYFTVATLTTAGSGTLEPASHYCREIATAQMVTDFLLLGVAVALVVARLARLAQESDGAQAPQDTPAGAPAETP